MFHLVAALLVTLAAPAQADPASEDAPPPCAPADAALWKAGRAASESLRR